MRTSYRQMAIAAVSTLALISTAASPPTLTKKKTTPFNIVPVTITSISTAGGQLVANGLVGITSFQAPITLTPQGIPRGDACPILDLALGPINLSLLGLNVDTSAICLEITAIPGGGLLGDLLCGITNLLSGGLSIGDVLALLTPGQLGILDAGLTQLLNQAVFASLSRSDAVACPAAASSRSTAPSPPARPR